jgi:hypothetical protein
MILISFDFLVLITLLVWTADKAISSAIAHDVGRAILYGILAVLLLLGVLALVGLFHG